MKQPLLFLSHAGEDTAAARELARHLHHAKVPVWLDVDRLRPGDRWMESLEEALQEATAFAVFVGGSGVARWVGQEVRVALDRSVAEEGFVVVPVLGPGSDPAELPVFLRQHQWVDLRGGLDDAGGLRELAEVVLGEDRRGERVRRSLLPPDRSPFLGLRTFAEEDAFLFFGRDRAVEELLEGLGAAPLLAVVGASGSGKSSLVRAGLLPALRRGRAPGGAGAIERGGVVGSSSPLASWRIAVFRPADDPFRELAAALPGLDPELCAAERIEVGSRIARELAESTSGSFRAGSPAGGAGGIERAVAALVPAGTRTLLVADQLEEAFTQTGDPELRRRFLDALLAAGRPGGDRPVHVLVTLRADFYSRCWEHPELPRRIAANQYPVERMARDQLREVIEKPLAMAGVEPEAGLVDELLDDAGDEPGNLPLLEHALFQLWDRPEARRFAHAAYREMGGLAGALEHHAEAVFAGLDAGEQELTRKLFSRLAVLGEPGTETRRRVPKEDLLAAGGSGEEARSRAAVLLDRWVERRLLTALNAGAEAGEERVEVAHEALLRSWDRLRGWLEEDREFLLWRQGLAGAVDAWECAKRSEGELLRGGPLARAAEFGISCGPSREFPGFAWTADGRTLVLQEATSGQLCTLAEDAAVAEPLSLTLQAEPGSVIVAGPSASWLLVFDAFGRAQPVDPRCSEALDLLRGHLTGTLVTTVSREGKWFASADDLGVLYLGRVDYDEPCNSFRHLHSLDDMKHPVAALALSEKHLAAGRRDGEILLWQPESSWDQYRVLVSHASEVAHVAFSPDDRWLISADEQDQLLLWDLSREVEPVRIDWLKAIRAIGFRSEGSEFLVAHEPDSFDPGPSEPRIRGQVHAFTVDLNRLQTLACRAAGRNLSAAEAREFLGEREPVLVCPGLPRGLD